MKELLRGRGARQTPDALQVDLLTPDPSKNKKFPSES